MTVDAVLGVVDRLGLPIVVVAAGVIVGWRLGGTLARALVASYRERVAALEADRDHFRDRSEAADDRTNGLCRELIDAARRRADHGSGAP